MKTSMAWAVVVLAAQAAGWAAGGPVEPLRARQGRARVVVRLTEDLAAAAERSAARSLLFEVRGRTGTKDLDALMARHNIRAMSPALKSLAAARRSARARALDAASPLSGLWRTFVLELDLRGRGEERALMDLRLDPDVDSAELEVERRRPFAQREAS